VLIGSSLHVPADLSRDQPEEYRLQLEEKINELNKIVWGDFGFFEH